MSSILERAARQDAQRSADLDASDKAMNSHVHPLFQQLLKPFAPPAHSFKREGGTGLSDSITPTCTCGWRGRPVYGYNDFQSTELEQQEVQHRMSAVSVQELRDGGVL